MLLRKRTILAIAFGGISAVAGSNMTRTADPASADHEAPAGRQLRYRNENVP
jgi:hypothetical protein